MKLIKGFDEYGTGGGCTAYGRLFNVDGHDFEVYATDGNLSAPESWEYVEIAIEIDGVNYDEHVIARSFEEFCNGVAELIAMTMPSELDYTLAEVWPEWTDYYTDGLSVEVRK